MRVTAEQWADLPPQRWDVCVVGAGPAGLTLARELANRGQSVLLIEGGGASGPGEAASLLEGEVRPQTHDFNGFPYPLDTSRDKGFGGASRRWKMPHGWRARALDPIDFEARAGVSAGWPINYDALIPYYRAAKRKLGLTLDEARADHWLSELIARSPFADSHTVVSRYFHRVSNTVFTDQLAWFSEHPEITLLMDATVTGLEQDAGSVTQATVRTLLGHTFSVSADRFVLAAGGLENARLMLAAKLGDAQDLIGKGFMEHPHVLTGFVRLKPGSLLAAYTRINPVGDAALEPILALSPAVLSELGLPNCGVWLRSISIKGVLSSLKNDLLTYVASRDVPARMVLDYARTFVGDIAVLGRLLLAKVVGKLVGRTRVGAVYRLYIESEQLPCEDSSVVLSQQTDVLGVPQLVLDWQLQPADFRTIRDTQAEIRSALEQAGKGTLFRLLGEERPAATIGIGNHHMGTTRMGLTHESGVVDTDCRVFGLDNVFVAGSSVFPSSGAANPTLTVIALALRLADHLAPDTTH